MLILLIKCSREPEGPLASVRGGRDVMDRPWCKEIVVIVVVIVVVGTYARLLFDWRRNISL